MAKFIRVDMPVDSPAGTLTLAKKVTDRHTALGLASPLSGFVDMLIFETNRNSAATLHKEADDSDNLAQSKYNQAAKLCGIAEGQNRQTEDTVYWFTLQARDVLLLKHKGTEETLEEYGFEVVISQTGARKNVRVEIPYDNPADLLALGAAIIDKHTALGLLSPLEGNVNMVGFAARVTDATTLLGEWDTQRSLSQSKHNQALNIMGYADGQTSQTPGTLYYDLATARDRLLQFTSGAEEQLQEWGFPVVISSVRTGKIKRGTLVIQEGDVAAGAIGNISLEAFEDTQLDTVTFEVTGTTLRFYAATLTSDPPASVFLDVLAGQTVSLSAVQAQAQLGFDPTHQLLNVKNIGAVGGHYKMTVKSVAGA